MPGREIKGVQLWVVVCTEYHIALGPFVDPEAALDVAKRMTSAEGSRCVYVPVRLQTDAPAQIVDLSEPEATPKTPEKWDGQYL
jgi:hypothetical protein